jgi:uncharacterized protein YbcI
MTSLHETPRTAPKAGELNASISRAVVRLLSDYVGRGPTKARTIHSGKVVLCVLEDTMTKAERSLTAGGHEDFVLQARHALQHTMQEDVTAAVEEFAHRKVIAFMSANHIEPDVALSLEDWRQRGQLPRAIVVVSPGARPGLGAMQGH